MLMAGVFDFMMQLETQDQVKRLEKKMNPPACIEADQEAEETAIALCLKTRGVNNEDECRRLAKQIACKAFKKAS